MSHHSNESPQMAAANAIGGKTARACDNCVLHRAQWYCAADDAFLCHPCDSSVHSANPLARRHERLRLKSSSSVVVTPFSSPKWHNGFKRKARTPRPHHRPVVPELESSGDDGAGDDDVEEEQLLYRVPVLDPALTFGDPSPTTTSLPPQAVMVGARAEFVPTELELEEFAADMESLLGRGLDGGESFCMEELGLVDERESRAKIEIRVKGEMGEDLKEEELSFEMEVDLSRETLDLDFGCGTPEMTEEAVATEAKEAGEEDEVTRGMGLKLNYEAVMDAWLVKGSSPWISDERPRVGEEEYWIEFMGMWGGAGVEMSGGGIQMMNVGREARVTRYREKRRTRLFSKKIRYEVRKLNAEKRPRMKGRFVKRTSFMSPATTAGRGGSGSGGGSVAVAC